jgi:hypothetical protein
MILKKKIRQLDVSVLSVLLTAIGTPNPAAVFTSNYLIGHAEPLILGLFMVSVSLQMAVSKTDNKAASYPFY